MYSKESRDAFYMPICWKQSTGSLLLPVTFPFFSARERCLLRFRITRHTILFFTYDCRHPETNPPDLYIWDITQQRRRRRSSLLFTSAFWSVPLWSTDTVSTGMSVCMCNRQQPANSVSGVMLLCVGLITIWTRKALAQEWGDVGGNVHGRGNKK